MVRRIATPTRPTTEGMRVKEKARTASPAIPLTPPTTVKTLEKMVPAPEKVVTKEPRPLRALTKMAVRVVLVQEATKTLLTRIPAMKRTTKTPLKLVRAARVGVQKLSHSWMP
jgi:hypothetical protein